MSMTQVRVKKRADTNKKVLTSDVIFSVGENWINIFNTWTNIELLCARCNKVYHEIENIGAWKCSQHALPPNGASSGRFYGPYMWDCCGEKYVTNYDDYSLGCVPCDHRIKDENYVSPINDAAIPIQFVKYLDNFKPESLLVGGDLDEFMYESQNKLNPQKWVVVRRYDKTEDFSRKTRGRSKKSERIHYGQWTDTKNLSWHGIGC